MAGQVAHQPLNAWVEVPPGAGIPFKFLINLFRIEHVTRSVFGVFAGTHDAGHFNGSLILRRQRQLNGVQFAFREAFYAVTGVTEQHAAGAVAVHQHGNQLLTCVLRTVAVAVCRLQQRFNILLANQFAQHVELFIAELVTGQQHSDGVGNRAIIFLLFNKLCEIVETVGIQQAQTRKVAFHTQLFRGGGQQQYAWHAFRQLFYRHIFTARRLFAPDEVVGFIDNQQIPLGIAQVFQTLLVTAGEVQRTDHQLFGFERVKRIVLRFGVAFVVKQGET